MSNSDIKVCLIGLDTSHTIEFAKRVQSPECMETDKVEGLRVVSCLRFPTPFQNKEGLDYRQNQLEGWGIPVTSVFDEAVEDCDAIMIEINDPSLHLEYIKRCANLGKPIFLDKPLADNIANGREICRIAGEKNLRIFSASSLRFLPEVQEACAEMPKPMYASIYGILGHAASGSSIVWYGVHAFELLQSAMGNGANRISCVKDAAGVVVTVEYPGGRRGVVESTLGSEAFGGCLRTNKDVVSFKMGDSGYRLAYTKLIRSVADFFRGGETPVHLEDTLEIMAMLDAAERSMQEGKSIVV